MDTGIRLVPYDQSMEKDWNEFVECSKNGTFLFNRGYMDYHKDRFRDNSIVFLRKGKIHSLLPACIKENIIYSHAGLTYGGLVMNTSVTTSEALEMFSLFKTYCVDNGIKGLVYKSVPYIYHSVPADEDLYALFRNNSRLTARSISSTVFSGDKIRFRELRRRGIKKAMQAGIEVKESDDLNSFWDILSSNLKDKYSTLPTHSLQEIIELKKKFPHNIRLFGAFDGEEMMGGVLCYFTKTCVHSQYISASPVGKEKGALDLIFDILINEISDNYRYFDFGISTEDGGKYLNESLIYQKEGFGGRAVCYDTYTMEI